MAVLLAQLPGPINLRLVLSDLKFADILHDLLTARGNRSGVPRAMAVDHNETRELAGTLHLEGASKDDAIAQIRAINALVTVGTTLTLQSTGATDAVTLKVLPSRGVSQPLDELFELDCAPVLTSGVFYGTREPAHVLASCAFSFTCEPYAYGPEAIVFQGVVSPPALVDINVPGDYPTPLKIAWTPSNRAGWVDSFAMGLLPDQTTAFGSLFRDSPWGTVDIVAGNPAHCQTAGGHGLFTGQVIRIFGTATTPSTIANYRVTVLDSTHFHIPLNVTVGGSGYWSPWAELVYGSENVAGASDADAYGGVAMQHAVDDWVTWQINDTALPRGTYLPFVRMGKTTTGANPSVRLSQAGGDAAQMEFAGAMAGYSTNRWPRTVAAPAMRVTSGATSFFKVDFRAGSLGGAARFDWLAMLPISWGYLLQLAATPWEAVGFLFDSDGTAYLDGVAQTSGISTSGMNALGAQSLLFLMGSAEQQPTFDGTLSIYATPRYTLWA